MNQETQAKPFDLESEIADIFNIPQFYTDGLTPEFATHYLEIFCFHPEWTDLDVIEQEIAAGKVLMKMEEQNKLKSKVTQVKVRHFDDDIDPPTLRKRVRVYQLVR